MKGRVTEQTLHGKRRLTQRTARRAQALGNAKWMHTGNVPPKVLPTQPGLVAHASNPSMQEAEAGPGLQGHPQLHSSLRLA